MYQKRKRLVQGLLTIVAMTLAALAVAACGNDDNDNASAPSGGGETTAARGNDADRKFLEGMSEHHAGGVEYGKIAVERGENEETKQLGRDVEGAQSREIDVMKDAHQRLFGEELVVKAMPDPVLLALEEAEPFDRAFYDGLIPHHQEAIRMAREELQGGQDPELKQLAQSIVDTQSTEIENMNEWRTKFYGAPSPAGGVPKEGEPADENGGGGHSG